MIAAHTADRPLFRMVHFIVNPLAGQSVPVAALVLDADGKVSPLLAPRTLHADCLGSDRASALIQFDELPRKLGPHFVLTTPQPVPDVENPVSWVKSAVWPALRHEKPEKLAKKRAPALASLGREFFRRHQAAKFVHDNFRLEHEARHMEPVTHWSKAGQQTVLMEPLSAQRKNLDEDLERVCTRVHAYHSVLHDNPNFRILTYMLRGLDESFKHEVRDAVQGVAEVYDVSLVDSRQKLLGLVRPPAQLLEPT